MKRRDNRSPEKVGGNTDPVGLQWVTASQQGNPPTFTYTEASTKAQGAA